MKYKETQFKYFASLNAKGKSWGHYQDNNGWAVPNLNSSIPFIFSLFFFFAFYAYIQIHGKGKLFLWGLEHQISKSYFIWFPFPCFRYMHTPLEKGFWVSCSVTPIVWFIIFHNANSLSSLFNSTVDVICVSETLNSIYKLEDV